jgi:hypothetical protein
MPSLYWFPITYCDGDINSRIYNIFNPVLGTMHGGGGCGLNFGMEIEQRFCGGTYETNSALLNWILIAEK